MNDNAKYQRGKIYLIRSHVTDMIYVGSTVEKYLSTRLKGHRNGYNQYKKGSKKYQVSFDILEIDENAYIELYEDYPCESRQQLTKREGEVIRSLDCINKRIEGRTRKEWEQDNKEYVKEWHKQWYINNKDKIKAQHKQWYANNREEQKAKHKQWHENNKDKNREKHNCECGGKYTHQNKKKHFKTKKHQDYIEFMTN